MKTIISSIVFNIVGIVLIVFGFILNIQNGFIMTFAGIVFLITSLLILILRKDILKDISGDNISNKLSILHKYFFSIWMLLIIISCTVFFIITLVKSYSMDFSLLIVIFLFIIALFIPLRTFQLKQIKFDGEFIYISNFIEFNKIPLREIKTFKIDYPIIFKKIQYNCNDKAKRCFFFGKTKFFGFVADNKYKEFIDLINKNAT